MKITYSGWKIKVEFDMADVMSKPLPAEMISLLLSPTRAKSIQVEIYSRGTSVLKLRSKFDSKKDGAVREYLCRLFNKGIDGIYGGTFEYCSFNPSLLEKAVKIIKTQVALYCDFKETIGSDNLQP